MTHINFASPFDFDMALQDPVWAMMRRGLRVDAQLRNRMSEENHARWKQLQADLDRVCGMPLNVNSHGGDGQVAKWLYGTLNLPVRYKDKKPTVDEDALRALLAIARDGMDTAKTESNRHRWMLAFLSIMLILKIRGVRKLLSSYLDCPLDMEDGILRARSTITVGKTETARFAASKTLWDTGLNLQTNPHGIRTIYIPDDGMEIAEFDLNRGESWVYAHLAEDPEMMRIHQDFLDFHSETAIATAEAFGGSLWATPAELAQAIKKLDKTSPEWEKAYKLRFLGKKLNHASSYQMGPFRAAEVVNEEADDTGITVTVAQMKVAQELWRHKYVGIKSWWDSIEKQLDATRTMTTPYGRTRIFYDAWGSELFKKATAYVPQSTSVDYLNLGMLRVYHELDVREAFKSESLGRSLELLHQNHDSILVQYPIEHRDEAMGAVRERLTSRVVVNGHDISIPVEGSCGSSWGSLQEWEG